VYAVALSVGRHNNAQRIAATVAGANNNRDFFRSNPEAIFLPLRLAKALDG
jgi:hypothetical protein